jgi:tRNA(fMet)-specific endonuclease VapC
MKPALIDTDILSLFFRGNANVINQFQAYLAIYNQINISIITYYEILSGLKHRDAQRQLDLFLEFANQNAVLPLNQQSVTISANIYAKLRLPRYSHRRY